MKEILYDKHARDVMIEGVSMETIGASIKEDGEIVIMASWVSWILEGVGPLEESNKQVGYCQKMEGENGGAKKRVRDIMKTVELIPYPSRQKVRKRIESESFQTQ